MRRRDFLGTALPLAPVVPAAPRKPNILFLYSDDQAGWTLRHAGNVQAHTPNLDRLCREGAYFANSLSPRRCAARRGRA
jgi:uncharacterized sulfatase